MHSYSTSCTILQKTAVSTIRLLIKVKAIHSSSCVILYNQRDATYTMFFIIITAGVGGLEQPIHTSGRQQESMTLPKAAHTVL